MFLVDSFFFHWDHTMFTMLQSPVCFIRAWLDMAPHNLQRTLSTGSFGIGAQIFHLTNWLLQILMEVFNFLPSLSFTEGWLCIRTIPVPLRGNSTHSQCLAEEIVLPPYRRMKKKRGWGGGFNHSLPLPAPVSQGWRFRIQRRKFRDAKAAETEGDVFGDLSYFLHGRQNCEVQQFGSGKDLPRPLDQKCQIYFPLVCLWYLFCSWKYWFCCVYTWTKMEAISKAETAKTNPTKAKWKTKRKVMSSTFLPSV